MKGEVDYLGSKPPDFFALMWSESDFSFQKWKGKFTDYMNG